MRHQRKSAAGIAAPLKFMYAKYDGSCKCGRRIMADELMCYDAAAKRAYCVSCGKRTERMAKSNLSEVERGSEAQELLDELNRLINLPPPADPATISHVSRLKTSLQKLAQTDVAVRAALMKREVRRPVVVIAAQFPGKCASCRMAQDVGAPVAFNTESRKISCYQCVAP